MAADTAYLEGGPCAKTTHKLTAAESDSGELVCKGGLYQHDYKAAPHKGDIVFKYTGPSSTTAGTVKAAHVHHGWTDIRHSVNHEMPGALRTSQRHTHAALRSLARARKVLR